MRQSQIVIAAGAPSGAEGGYSPPPKRRRLRWPPSPRTRARLSRIARFSISGLAIGLGAGIVWHLGPRPIWENLYRVGWRISFVFLLGFPRFFLNTIGWRLFLPKGLLPLPSLYRIKIEGELLTRMTPLHFMGGDTARVLMMGRIAPRSELAASVLMDRTAVTLGGAAFILSGFLLGSLVLPISPQVKLVAAGFLALSLLFMIFLIGQQKKGLLASGLKFLKKIGLEPVFSKERFSRWREKSAPFDQTIRDYYKGGHGKLILATFLNFLSRILAAAEIYLLFLLLEIPLGPLHALLFGSISLFLTASLFVVPGTLGIAEGTYGLFFQWLGLDPAVGVSLELSRKVNAILWFAFGGLLALSFKSKKDRAEPIL